MEKTSERAHGSIRFIVLFIIILVLLNIAQRYTWNRPSEKATDFVWPAISLKLSYSGIRQPTHISNAGDGTGRLFITEQAGRVLLAKGNAVMTRPFLDIRDQVSCCGERGLLSISFPPGYASKKYFYVNYTDRRGDTVVARYRISQDPDIALSQSEEIIITIKQPYSNHNGGQLAFGPDGYLYIGMGDGGSAGDPQGHGQNPSSLLGKMLRLDVESGRKPYAIPPANPFLNHKAYRPEIWAIGLRNPWRFSFDKATGDLYIADVGQYKYEEINHEPKGKGGRNYGWNTTEGLHCYRTEECSMAGLSMPVAEYDHDRGCSVTGGVVYRGKAFQRLQGVYFYGDYCSGRIWGLKQSGDEWLNSELRNSGLSISTFGEDEAGEVYVADYNKGNIYRIEAAAK